MVDDEDFEFLNRFKWCAWNPGGNKFYAVRQKEGTGHHGVIIKMHKEIMLPPQGKIVDHISGDGLDNRRRNLRICTVAENCYNKTKLPTNPSGFKNVYRSGNQGKWKVEVGKNGVQYFGGVFISKLEAAKKANELMLKLHGEFARLNVIPK